MSSVGLTGSHSDQTVLYDSHVDTVPAGDLSQWTHPPFGGDLANERIYGRGATDMKGPLAAAMVGLAQAHNDKTLNGTVFLCASTGEEHIEGLTLTPVMDIYNPDLVIICEPTALKLATAQRGRGEIEIFVHGKSRPCQQPAGRHKRLQKHV